MDGAGRAWWPPSHPWSERWTEYGRVTSWASDQSSVFYYVVPLLTVAAAVVVDTTTGLAGRLPWIGVLVVADVLLVKLLDARLAKRSRARARWTDPELLAAARRVGLRPPADPTRLLGRRLVVPGSRHPIGDPSVTTGVLEGTVGGRRAVVAGLMARRGPIHFEMLGIAVLRRPHPKVDVRPRDVPMLLGRRAATELDRRFVATGPGVDVLGSYVEDWLLVQTADVAYAADGDLAVVVLRRPEPDVGETVDLAALVVAFADRLDGPA